VGEFAPFQGAAHGTGDGDADHGATSWSMGVRPAYSVWRERGHSALSGAFDSLRRRIRPPVPCLGRTGVPRWGRAGTGKPFDRGHPSYRGWSSTQD
jgi:hypothetical protein